MRSRFLFAAVAALALAAPALAQPKDNFTRTEDVIYGRKYGLAMTMDDLRPSIEGRPAGELAKRVVPNYPGKTPPILPPAWLQPLRSETAPA